MITDTGTTTISMQPRCQRQAWAHGAAAVVPRVVVAALADGLEVATLLGDLPEEAASVLIAHGRQREEP